MQTSQASTYIRIRLDSISIDDVFNFDLFQFDGSEHRLYRGQSIPIERRDISKLQELGTEFLYVPENQKEALFDYERKSLASLLRDESVSIEKKAHKVGEISATVISELMDSLKIPGNIKAAEEQSRHHVELSMKSLEARRLLRSFHPNVRSGT